MHQPSLSLRGARLTAGLLILLFVGGCATDCFTNPTIYPTYDLWEHRTRLNGGVDFYSGWFYGCPH